MKKIVCFAVLLGVCVCSVAAGAGEMRTWVSMNGQATTAEFVRLSKDGKTVTLKKQDGKNISVKLEQFSAADKKYVARQSDPKAEEPAQNTTTPVAKPTSIVTATPPAPARDPNAPVAKPSSIVTRQDCIDTILSAIDDAADRATVLKWLQLCKGKDNIEYDKVQKTITCHPPWSPQLRSFSMIMPRMLVSINKNFVLGTFTVLTHDNKAMFPQSLTIADESGVVWESSGAKWSHDANLRNDMNIWVIEEAKYIFFLDLTEKEVDTVMGALAKNDECVVRISGRQGRRDIDITAAQAQDFKIFYDAYNVLKKYYAYE